MNKNDSLIHKLWTIIYALFYPVLMVFSSVFLFITQIMSYPSRLVRRILEKINLPNQS